MSLLNHLWDDTVAGPLPDSGLGKLRKQSTFGSRLNSGKESEGGSVVRSYGDDVPEEARKVTRSIMIVKPPGYSSSPPVSPAGSTPPVSPFSGVYYVHDAAYTKEEESLFGFEEGQRRMRMRRQVRLDPEVLVLLTACEI